MTESIILFLACVGLSIYFWCRVFSSSTLKKLNEPGDSTWSAEHHAGNVAGWIIGALVCSIATLIFITVGIYRVVGWLFKAS